MPLNTADRETTELADLVRDADAFAPTALHAAYRELLISDRDHVTGYLNKPDRTHTERYAKPRTMFDLGARWAYNRAIIAFEEVRRQAAEALKRYERTRGRKEE